MPKRILSGFVTASKNDKTVSVLVSRKVTHPIYKKIIKKSKKFSAHDPKNKFNVGDEVRIIESAPVSKTKKWEVLYSS